jgi:hypothetical protein
MALRSLLRAWTLALVVAVMSAAVWVFRVPMLRTAGTALVWRDAVHTADVIVVPSWTGDAGALQAADLVHSGVASRVAVINAPPDPADKILIARGIVGVGAQSWAVSLLHMLGVSHVELIDYANGTESEAFVVHRWCEAERIGVAIVVSTPDHSRRLRRVLSRTGSEGGTKFIVVPTEYARFDARSWWSSRAGIRTEIVELEKLGLDILRHPFN